LNWVRDKGDFSCFVLFCFVCLFVCLLKLLLGRKRRRKKEKKRKKERNSWVGKYSQGVPLWFVEENAIIETSKKGKSTDKVGKKEKREKEKDCKILFAYLPFKVSAGTGTGRAGGRNLLWNPRDVPSPNNTFGFSPHLSHLKKEGSWLFWSSFA